jgi:hypothetical protein
MTTAFDDGLRALAKRAESAKDKILTEEATKTALVMPFLQLLGYDVFDPSVVIPEFTADHGIKKGEKVDYAIKIGDEIRILIECKPLGTNLNNAGASQLYRYFSVTNARLSLLTNGAEYRFFSDLDNSNKMDQDPFFIFSLSDTSSFPVAELKKFRAEQFALASILNSANDLKYMSIIKQIINKEIDQPSDEFVEIIARRAYQGRLTAQVREWITSIVSKAMREILRDRLNQRLSDAIQQSEDGLAPIAEITNPIDDPDIETTQEEVEGFQIVRAILRKHVAAKRVFMRDAKSYCAILLDDNNRKTICRLHFNRKQKRVGIFVNKEETKYEIDNLEDIFKYAEFLEASVLELEGKQA